MGPGNKALGGAWERGSGWGLETRLWVGPGNEARDREHMHLTWRQPIQHLGKESIEAGGQGMLAPTVGDLCTQCTCIVLHFLT